MPYFEIGLVLIVFVVGNWKGLRRDQVSIYLCMNVIESSENYDSIFVYGVVRCVVFGWLSSKQRHPCRQLNNAPTKRGRSFKLVPSRPYDTADKLRRSVTRSSKE